jgi:hypothetical protein
MCTPIVIPARPLPHDPVDEADVELEQALGIVAARG